MTLNIAKRELNAAFRTPTAWVLLAASQLILGWVFLRVLDRFSGLEAPERSAGLNLELTHNLFGSGAVLMLLIAPLFASRMLSGEMREGTWQLLVTAPVRLRDILLGKFLALGSIMALLALLPLWMGLTLLGAAPVDLGLLLAAALGLWLSGLLFCAVALFAASLSSQPLAAAVIGYGLLMFLSVINQAEQLTAARLSVLDWLSWNQHMFWFLAGVVRVSDLAYFALMTLLFLLLAQRQLDNRQLG